MAYLRILYVNLFSGIISAVLAQLNANDYMKREYSLIKPYSDARWDFIGNTIVTNNHVRLTSDHKSEQGAIWNNLPCVLRDWELHVHFRIHGSVPELYGDGIGIWYTKDKLQSGSVFGSKDYFVGLAVFLDTYANQNGPHSHSHPYISAMVNNGSYHYDHDRDGTHTELAGCASNIRGVHHDTFIAIRYERDVLTVSTDTLGENVWKLCFTAEGVRLPTGYYFGASAATGDLHDFHDIISMKLYDIGVERKDDANVDYSQIEPAADFFASPRDHVDGSKKSSLSSVKSVVIVVIGLVAVILFVMIGYIIYTQVNVRQSFY